MVKEVGTDFSSDHTFCDFFFFTIQSVSGCSNPVDIDRVILFTCNKDVDVKRKWCLTVKL